MTRRSRSRSVRSRRLVVPLVAGALMAAGLTVAPLGAPPGGAVGLGWVVTVEAPATVTGPVVAVTGRSSLLLGQVRTVRVRLVPRGELPAACGVPEGTGPVTGGAYTVEVRPGCNGPYRAEVVASGTDLLGRSVNSGSPAVRDLAVADPGPAPAPPAAAVEGEGITVSWAAPADPDIVGWTLLAEGAPPRSLPAGTTRAVVPATAGDHRFELVARRWGAEGPGGPEVSSPASGATPVHVQPTPLEPPARPPAPGTSGNGTGDGAAGPPAGQPAGGAADTDGAGGTGTVGSGGSARSRGPLDRGAGTGSLPSGGASRRTAPAPGDPAYGEQLPYGDRDGAGAEGADDVEPSGEQVAAGAPSARVVRTTERTSPGLVVPFALAFGLASAAIWLWATLRRSRRAVEG